MIGRAALAETRWPLSSSYRRQSPIHEFLITSQHYTGMPSYASLLVPHTRYARSNARATHGQTSKRFPEGHKRKSSRNTHAQGLPELIVKLAGDFPGIENSEVDTALRRSSAFLLVRASRTANPDASVRLSSEARRTLEGLRRRYATVPKPTQTALADYLAEPNPEMAASVASESKTEGDE